MKNIKLALLSAVTAAVLAGCGAKDNTPPPKPLMPIEANMNVQTVWEHSTHGGTDGQYLVQGPSVVNGQIAVVDYKGYVSLFDDAGHRLWQVKPKAPFSTSPTIADGKVFAESLNGDVFALDASDGKVLWHAQMPSSVLAAVAVANGIVVVHPHNGDVLGLDEATGKTLWHYIGSSPQMTLEGDSAPIINDHAAIVAFSNGQMMSFNLQNGQTLWEQTVASPSGSSLISSMVDIIGNPVLLDGVVYAVSYQGNVAAMEVSSGSENWVQPMSSYAGLAVAGGKVLVTDSKGDVWALDQHSGHKLWVQNALEYRSVSAPGIVGNSVAVGDFEGYVHFLSMDDGHFVARARVDNSGVRAQPVIVGDTVYVTTNDGTIAALKPGK